MKKYRHKSPFKKNLELARQYLIPQKLPSGNFLMPDHDKAMEYISKARAHKPNSIYSVQEIETIVSEEKIDYLQTYYRTTGGGNQHRTTMRRPVQPTYVKGKTILRKAAKKDNLIEEQSLGSIADIVSPKVKEKLFERMV
ncbi:hypothetical protein C0585_02320 [Candidatus Woesearchaeota archaeon]|nr:MAG: hypothetical protein C0585_02320 [Candidatus Woesearchaeota archaeon]